MNDKISKVFGERLKNLRDARGLRQEDVGDWFKMQKSTVSQWENGRLPHVMILNELADKFGVSESVISAIKHGRTHSDV